MKLKIIFVIFLMIFLFSCKRNKISENIDIPIISNNNEIELLITDDNYNELYEENNGEYFNVKIIREENNGLMNIIPCCVYIYNNEMEPIDNENVNIFTHYIIPNIKEENRLHAGYFVLIGGETAFLILPDGNYFIKIVTTIENQIRYLDHLDRDWESTIYDFKIIQNDYMEIKIIPGGDDKFYNGTWIIEE